MLYIYQRTAKQSKRPILVVFVGIIPAFDRNMPIHILKLFNFDVLFI
jgi:hypothetical protein